MAEYRRKFCPFLPQSDTEPSFTLPGKSYTHSYFQPCLGNKCAAYVIVAGHGVCVRFGTPTHTRIPDTSDIGHTCREG